MVNTLGQDLIHFGNIAHRTLQLPINLMNILVVALIGPGSAYTGLALGLMIFSFIGSSLSFLGLSLAPFIYAYFWDPESFSGVEDLTIFKMIYMKALSLIVNIGGSIESLNYAIYL